MNISGKRVLIAPYSPTSKAFKNALLNYDSSIHVIGYLDNYKSGNFIYKKNQLNLLDFDLILVCSPNHFFSIFANLKSVVSEEKIIKIVIKNYQYVFIKSDIFKKEVCADILKKIQFFILKWIAFIYDIIGRDSNKLVFFAKAFVGSNLKAFYLYCAEKGKDVTLVTDNPQAYDEFKNAGYQVAWLDTWKSVMCIARADWIIQDQANHTDYFDSFGEQQKTLQMWHGIPLKKLSPQHNITYDILLSTSEFVSKSSLGSLFLHREVVNSGYPRNDLFKEGFIKDEHLLTDHTTISWVQQGRVEKQKILVYMPTHREYDVGFDVPGIKVLPLDWARLDQDLREMDALLVLKLHPFVEAQYEKLISEHALKRVKVYDAKKDIYPLLRYSDLLITDYSSVYFDYLLLNKPIVFYCYDFEQYSDNKDGWTYPFATFTPGEKIFKPCYTDLVSVIKKSLIFDLYKDERSFLINQLIEQNECYSDKLLKHVN